MLDFRNQAAESGRWTLPVEYGTGAGLTRFGISNAIALEAAGSRVAPLTDFL